MEKYISDYAKSIEASGIRRFFSLANKMDDVISLGIGEPNFKIHEAMCHAVITKLENGRIPYTPNEGLLELRQLIFKRIYERSSVKYNPDNEIILTSGSSQGLDIIIRTIINPGEEILIILYYGFRFL